MHLEQMIVTLELQPGLLLAERELFEKVGFGRTPVREAMQRLSWEGLIEVRPRSGVQITEIRLEDYLKVIELRCLLEPRFARAATRFANDLHRELIGSCRKEMQESVDRDDMKLFLRADKTFDSILADAAANRYLSNILGPLQTHSRRFWFRFMARGGVSWSADLHMKIMDAFIENDVEVAEANMNELMRAMMGKVRELAE